MSFVRRHGWDLCALLVVLGIAVAAGGHRLFFELEADWHERHSLYPASVFGASVMVAAGRGFVAPESGFDPELDRFLRQEIASYSLSQLDQAHPVRPADFWQCQHRYMLYTMALLWRVFGVSWTVLKILLLLLLAVSAVTAYAFLRLMAGPFLAMLGAAYLAQSAPFMAEVANLRDFSKAPFILGVLLLLGLLVRDASRPRRLLALAAFLGAVQAVGYGFRHDVVICLLPAAFVLLTAPVRAGQPAWAWRLGAVACMALVFATVSWPVMRSYSRAGAPMHDIAMGLAPRCEAVLGLEPASYQRLQVLRDEIVYATFAAAARSADPEQRPFAYDSPECEKGGRAFLTQCVGLFPGDTLSRGYASTVRILAAAFPDRQAGHSVLSACLPSARVRILGLLAMAAAVFAVLSARRPRLAWQCFFIALYFCAYPCLQFMPRHVFHLIIFPVALAVLALRGMHLLAWPRIRRLLHRNNAAHHAPKAAHPSATCSYARGAVSLALLLLLLVLPLAMARAAQRGMVGRYMAQLQLWEREPLDTATRPLGSWTLFQPRSRLADQSTYPTETTWPYTQDYLALTLAASPEPRAFWLLYETQNGINDFSCRAVAPACAKSATLTHYFPVYENGAAWLMDSWARFVGVALPADEAQAFLGLARLRGPVALTPVISASVPERIEEARLCQAISFGPTAWNPGSTLPGPFQKVEQARQAEQAGNQEEARRLFEAAVAQDVGHVQALLDLARMDEAAGDLEGAEEHLARAAEQAPDFVAVHEQWDALLAAHRRPEMRVGHWKSMTIRHQSAFHPWVFLGRALLEEGDAAAAVRALDKAFEVGAQDLDARRLLGNALCGARRLHEAYRLWDETVERFPEAGPEAAQAFLVAAEGMLVERETALFGKNRVRIPSMLSRAVDWCGRPDALDVHSQRQFKRLLPTLVDFCIESGALADADALHHLHTIIRRKEPAEPPKTPPVPAASEPRERPGA